MLRWSSPAGALFLPTHYVLQARRDRGEWVVLSSEISADRTELLVQGLFRVTPLLTFLFDGTRPWFCWDSISKVMELISPSVRTVPMS